MRDLPPFEYVTKRDYHPEPFRRVVVLGESHVAQGTWVRVFGALLNEFQGPPPAEIIAAGVGGSVISPRSPGYATSGKPSAAERFREEVIARQPDLVIVSYGLNDMRAGMHPEEFRQELTAIVSEIRAKLDPVIVLTNVYNMSAYALYPPFDKGSVAAAEIYNLMIRQVANQQDALLSDIWQAEGVAPWVMTADTVHSNRLGHTLIGHQVFQTVATQCSGAARSLWQDPSLALQELAEKHRSALERTEQRLAAMGGKPAGTG
jgi:lysophospholipase L1-like esterase